jgi:sialic acid synthase SpsE
VPASFRLGDRLVGPDEPPLVIAEVGINHEGELDKALQMIDEVADLGGECVKFQSHVVEDEMIPNDVIPGNADESIWDIMVRCALDEDAERALQERAESRGLLFLSTPFSRAAADRLEGMGVVGYKIGSGECNNYPLIEHVASFGKPMIVSTGMNDLASVSKTVAILRRKQVPYALLQCTSMYPTPYEKVRLGGLTQMGVAFPDAVLGLSDHSPSIYPMLGSVALGASILERHFTSDMAWPGPDIEVSMDPSALKQLLEGSRAIHAARGGTKEILPEEQPTIDFAYSCVVTTAPISAGETFDGSNTWVKRPGTGEILAEHYDVVIGRAAARDLPADVQVGWSDLA